MNDTNQPSADSGQQWWLSIHGKPDGPHSKAYILAELKTGAISPQTYACQVGGQEWKYLSEWPAFASACPLHHRRHLHPTRPARTRRVF